LHTLYYAVDSVHIVTDNLLIWLQHSQYHRLGEMELVRADNTMEYRLRHILLATLHNVNFFGAVSYR